MKIGVAAGHLMFKLRDGSSICCNCIGEPYASEIAGEHERLLACLRNARNLLADGGYHYVKEIDRVLANLKN